MEKNQLQQSYRMHDFNIEQDLQRKIREELYQLAAFYKLSDRKTLDILQSVDLSHYVEIVMHPSGFELVIGGMNRAKALILSATAQEYPQPVIEAFKLFTQRFSNKMLYSKQCFGPDKSPPSLYLCVVESWKNILPELAKLPGMDQISEAYRDISSQRKICFLLGFSMDKTQHILSVKTYHLAPFQVGPAQSSPFLISHRYCNGKLSTVQKTYTAGVSWDAFEGKKDWDNITAAGSEIFGTKYGMFLGCTYDSGNLVDKKGYVLRYDKRENNSYQLNTYNYYAEEGAYLMNTGDYISAIQSFTEAIAFHRDRKEVLAELYNMRGTLHYGLRNLNEAQADFLQAIELHKQFASAHNNLSATYMQSHQYEKAVMSAGMAIYINPASDPTNFNISKRLLRQAEMQS